jgi:hypothetical protein
MVPVAESSDPHVTRTALLVELVREIGSSPPLEVALNLVGAAEDLERVSRLRLGVGLRSGDHQHPECGDETNV